MKRLKIQEIYSAAVLFAEKKGLVPDGHQDPDNPRHWMEAPVKPGYGKSLEILIGRSEGADINFYNYVDGTNRGFHITFRKGVPVEFKLRSFKAGQEDLDLFLQILYKKSDVPE